MTYDQTFAFLKSLILVRFLALPAKNRPGPQKIKQDLAKFFEGIPLEQPWNDCFEQAVEQLLSERLIERRPISLTETGRQQAYQFLGVTSLPSSIQWTTLRDQYLVAKSLGLRSDSSEDRSQIADGQKLRGYVLKREHHLNGRPFPTVKQATDALAWRELGVQTEIAFNEKNVLRYLLGDSLEGSCKSSTDQLRNQLVSQALNCGSQEVREQRWEILRRLASPRTSSFISQPASLETPDSIPFVLSEFARQVNAVACSIPTGHFGDHKVFVNHIWHQMQQRPICKHMTLETFKQRLTQANTARLLTLTKIDLVGAVNPDDLAESEIQHLQATFHCVKI